MEDVSFQNQTNKNSSKRYFKLMDPATGKYSGRYIGSTPMQATSKAFTKIITQYQPPSVVPENVTIVLKESTRGSNGEIYTFSASRKKLCEPEKVTTTDKDTGETRTITYEYMNCIEKI